MHEILLPKIDLHSHLDGSLNPKTIFELAQEENIQLPTDSFDDFLEYVKAPADCDSLKTYLERFVLPIEIMQTIKNLERVSYEYVLSLKKSNVKYAEVRFAPIFHTNKGLTIEKIISAVLTGLKVGTLETGIKTNLIICGMRHLPVEDNMEVFKIAKQFIGNGVVAVDLAGNEADFPPILHKKAFDLAKELGFNITIHAGETGNAKNIVTSINELHATRIGHGVSAINDIEAINLIKEKNITLEVCPTSNIQTKAFPSMPEHPFKKLLNLGINITVNTDNMTVSDTDMNNEYKVLTDTFGLEHSDFRKIYEMAVEASFATDDLKKKLLEI